MAKADLTAQRLRELLHYDPETGVFTRRVSRRGWFAGSIVGCVNPGNGYRNAIVDGTSIGEHRLAFLYMTGALPEFQVDHINGVRSDNRWANLRPVSQDQNMQNTAKHRAGDAGVTFEKSRNKWKAQIKAFGRHHNIGRYETREDAHKAYLAARRELHGV